MTKKLRFASAILALAAGAALAADAVSGKWTITQAAHNGGSARLTVLDLKADGMTLTGTVTAPMGGREGSTTQEPTPMPISNGKVNGNTVTFDVVRVFGGRPLTTKFTGTVSGETMHVKQTIDMGKGPDTVEVDAKRGGM